MIQSPAEPSPGAVDAIPDAATCARAVEARDARFDGVFFVAILTTGIYCRPICPSRRARAEHRRFFATASDAECAGFRPCLRCRPELAPGAAAVDAVPRVARAAAARIAAGALNGGSVAGLARELGLGERYLRRVMKRSLGTSPLELALTHRLLLARKLLRETQLSVTHIAYASGFESLRRFNAAFRERYRCAPSALRPRGARNHATSSGPAQDAVRVRLTYRPPFAWEALLLSLVERAVDGVERVEPGRYTRSVLLDGCRGVVSFTHSHGSVLVDVSHSLLPALMPLLSRMRALLDLDADPRVIDGHLTRGPLRPLVERCPGLRVPGPFNDFEGILRALLGGTMSDRMTLDMVARELGEPVETDHAEIIRLMPGPAAIRDAGTTALQDCGVDPARSRALIAVADAMRDGAPVNPPLWHNIRAIARREGLDASLVGAVAQVGRSWSDAVPADREALRHVAAPLGIDAPRDLERYRPWRAYAVAHLWHEAMARELDSPSGKPGDDADRTIAPCGPAAT